MFLAIARYKDVTSEPDGTLKAVFSQRTSALKRLGQPQEERYTRQELAARITDIEAHKQISCNGRGVMGLAGPTDNLREDILNAYKTGLKALDARAPAP